MGRPCWICGSPDSTREHVWPNWMKQIASGPRGRYVVGLGDDEADWRKWEGAPFELTARVLCGSCNSRLGQLERQVKQLILAIVGRGDIRLYVRDQAILA